CGGVLPPGCPGVELLRRVIRGADGVHRVVKQAQQRRAVRRFIGAKQHGSPPFSGRPPAGGRGRQGQYSTMRALLPPPPAGAAAQYPFARSITLPSTALITR